MKDYFSILGLQAGANDDDVRQAYKRLAMQHHPDRGGDAAKFQEIQEAYSTLTDPQRRSQWEQQQHAQHFQHGPFNFSFNFGPDINDILKGFHGGDPFSQFRNRAPRNRDLRAVVELDLASTLNPQQRHIDIRSPELGLRTVKIDIPRGVQSGMQMRCPGHGESHISGLPAGDLIVEFHVTVPAGLRIEGINVIRSVIINCVDAITGCKTSIAGVDNKLFEVNIPSGTQPGTILRLANQGLWDVNHPVRGDLLVDIQLEVPKRLTPDQLESLSKLT